MSEPTGEGARNRFGKGWIARSRGDAVSAPSVLEARRAGLSDREVAS